MLYKFLAWCLGFPEDPMDDQVILDDILHRRLITLCQDMIFVSSKGRTMTHKSLSLAMATRQITGSEKMVSLLNGFGHCVPDSFVRAHETALAKTQKECIIPSGFCKDTFTTLVWDNIDFGEETQSGKGTTHAANGIIIQKETSFQIIREYPKEVTYDKHELSVLAPLPNSLHISLEKYSRQS